MRDEVEAQRADAEQKVVAAREEWGRTETALEQRITAWLTAQVEIRELERQQAEESATRKALAAEIQRLGDEAVARERELDQVRDTFSRDLEKLRETASRAEERLRASEKRALLEIDRERSAAAKAQKDLAEAAKRAERRDTEHRRAVDALQAQQGEARHQAGILQGKLAALETAYASLQDQLKSLRGAERMTDRITARTPTPRAPQASKPPARRAARKAVVSQTVKVRKRQ